jgi:hypothetical protein
METHLAKVKETMLGNWESIAPEVRPSKNPDGNHDVCKRCMHHEASNEFEGVQHG